MLTNSHIPICLTLGFTSHGRRIAAPTIRIVRLFDKLEFVEGVLYMTAYSVVLFIIAMIILLWGFSLYKGNLSSLRPASYKRVKDKVAYGKAMGKAVFAMGVPQVLAGVIALLGEITVVVILTVVISVGGFLAGLFCMLKVEDRRINQEF